MVTLLSFVLLAQLFLPVQEQVTSAGAPPVEVLDVEVLASEFKARRVPDPRTAPPPGPVSRPSTAQDLRGVRGANPSREQPSIESRSRELREIGRRADPQPVFTRSSGGYVYEYRVRVKNTSPKKIRYIFWEYQLTDHSGAAVVSQRSFASKASLKPGSVKVLQAKTLSPPSRVVSADTSEENAQKQKVVITRVEFNDGSTWIRDASKKNN